MKNLIFVLFSVFVVKLSAQSPITEKIPFEQITNVSKPTSITFNPDLKEQSYFQIDMVESSIAKKKRLWKTYSPVLLIELAHGSRKEFAVFGTLDSKEQSTILNKEISMPIPYKQEKVSLDCKLYAINKRDKAQEVISSVNQFTSIPMLGLSSYVPYIQTAESVFKVIDDYFLKKKYSSVMINSNFSQSGVGTGLKKFQVGFYIAYNSDSYIDKKGKEPFELSKLFIDKNDNVKYKNEKGDTILLRDTYLDYIIINAKHFVSRDKSDFKGYKFYEAYEEAFKLTQEKNEITPEVIEKFNTVKILLFSEEESFTSHDQKLILTRMWKDLKEVPYDYTASTSTDTIQTASVLVDLRSALIEKGLLSTDEDITINNYESLVKAIEAKDIKSESDWESIKKTASEFFKTNENINSELLDISTEKIEAIIKNNKVGND